MHDEKQVVIRLLQSLCDCVEFALVRTAVVGLSLTGHRANQVTMHTQSKANHIDCFLNVGGIVAALFCVVNLVDDNIVLLLAVGGDIESGKPCFAAILSPGQEIQNGLLLLDDALLLLASVGDTLGTEDTLPILCRYFDLVFDGVILRYIKI